MKENEVRVLRLDNPPVNALGQSLRAAIVEGLAEANADSSVKAIVLCGNERAFSAGADITEFGTRKATTEPTLPDVLAAVESSPKPVVAAISGVCMGGGLELALAAHARVARPDAKVALPEITLGIIPGAGGTQRLPRAIPPADALDMMLTGKIRTADSLKDTGLFDDVTADVMDAAIRIAAELAAGIREVVLLRDRTADPEDVRAAVAKIGDTHPLRQAGQALLEAVQGVADLPFPQGIALESSLFTMLEYSEDAKALRHAFFAERAAGKLEGLKIKGAPVSRVGVVGAGTMGRGIAISVVEAGIDVILVDLNADTLANAKEAIAATFNRKVEKGRIEPEDREQLLTRLTYTSSLSNLAEADLVIEAVFEKMETKLNIFTQLDGICKPEAILASNTSMLSIDEIGASTKNPARVLGLHFFSPANVMRLLEVIRGAKTSHETLATALDFARRIGKVPVIAGVCHGFIGNRMLEVYLDRSFNLVEEGISPYDIDRALEDWGMAMGPFHMLDLAGNDVSYSVRKTRREMSPSTYISPLGESMYLAGRLGQKSGKGWYDYGPGAPKGRPSAEVEDIIGAHRKSAGKLQNAYSPDEIVLELIGALAREGKRILDERHAASASDIDVVYLYGYGFPRYHGGPMYFAASRGLI